MSNAAWRGDDMGCRCWRDLSRESGVTPLPPRRNLRLLRRRGPRTWRAAWWTV
jgi:hypothetical protein